MGAKDLTTDLLIRYGFQVLGALVIVAVGALAARWTGLLVDRRLQRRAMEPPMRALLVRALRILILLFAVVMALDKFGFQIAPLVAGIGVAGLGLGLALQGVLANVVAGLTIIFTKPFRVGEYVELLAVSGEVTTIEIFSTTLLHPDRSRVIVPNRKIVGEILHNFGTIRQLHLKIPIPRTADTGAPLRVASDVVAANARVLKDPAPLVGIAELRETSLVLAVEPWVRVADVLAAQRELMETLTQRLSTDAGGYWSQVEVRLVDGPAALTR